MEILLELLKYTLPALVVFLTVYVMLRQYFQFEARAKELDFKADNRNITLPLRLQAYERLTVLCDRISLPNLILRIRTGSMTADDLQIALQVAIQQEMDHNAAQQMYVSPELWQIISLAKNDAINTINQVAKQMPNGASGLDYSRELFRFLDEKGGTGLDKASLAIKKEVSLLL